MCVAASATTFIRLLFAGSSGASKDRPGETFACGLGTGLAILKILV
jgi:hypothetical protein